MLRPDVVVPQLERLAERELEDLLGARRERDRAGRRALAAPDDLLDPRPHLPLVDAELVERAGGDRVLDLQKAEQQMLRPDVGVAERARRVLGTDDDRTALLGEAGEPVAAAGRPAPPAQPRPRPAARDERGFEQDDRLRADRAPLPVRTCPKRVVERL